MNLFKYGRHVNIFFILSFIAGLNFSGALLIPFFTDWGNLSQFQIQILQAWFMLCIFVFEIPTGLIGDKHTKKFSILWGYFLSTLGVVTYITFSNFYIFLLAELLFALGIAFISCSLEGLFYEKCEENGLKEKYNKINIFRVNLTFCGMIFGALVGPYLLNYINIRYVFGLEGISTIIAFIITFVFVIDKKIVKGNTLVPNYKQIFLSSIDVFKQNKSFRHITLYVVATGSNQKYVSNTVYSLHIIIYMINDSSVRYNMIIKFIKLTKL